MSAWLSAWPQRLHRLIAPALIDKVPRDHTEPDSAFRRRRAVVAVVLLVGAVLLGLSLQARPGDPRFYLLTVALATTWVVGGVLSGPLHLGWIELRQGLRRPVVTPIALGLAAAAVFVLGALVVRQVGPLHDYVASVLDHARGEAALPILLITVGNGVAEEVFFRGALFAAIGRRHPVVISTAVYAVATLATGNPMLAFAALVLGGLFGLERRASGGILASTLTHVTWSTTMLFALPPLFR